MALKDLSPDVGYQLSEAKVDALAYADDVLLFAETRHGLQANLDRFATRLGQFGLLLNPGKSVALSLVPSGRQKKLKTVTEPTFYVRGSFLKQVSEDAIWRYLGIQFKGIGKQELDRNLLSDGLARIQRAPLKPQQRLIMLRQYLIPKYNHLMVLGSCTAMTLKALDKQVRSSIRSWLHLPKDTPVEYFHASVRDGGLGIPALKSLVPILKVRRIGRLTDAAVPYIRAAANSRYVLRQLDWSTRQARFRNQSLSTTADLRVAMREGLYGSVDGNGLKECFRTPLNTQWVTRAFGIPGRDYVQYHRLRINALPTRERTTRGFAVRGVPADRRLCRAGCNKLETAAHVIQQCHRTHGGRVLRHNNLVRQVQDGLREAGWTVYTEVGFNTSQGRRIPDIIACKGNRAVILDAQVVSADYPLELANANKARKYGQIPDLGGQVRAKLGLPEQVVPTSHAITLSWRGIWSVTSERDLRSFGVSAKLLRRITTMTLQGSHTNFTRFNSSTMV